MRGRFTSLAGGLLLVAAAAVSSWGCPASVTAGPPGPIIDVDPDPENGNIIDWKTTPDGGGTATVQAPDGGPIYTDCQLRDDFIGQVAILFKGCLSGTYQTTCTSEAAGLKAVRFVNTDDDIWITVSRDPSNDRISWQYYKKKATPDLCLLTSEAATPGHVPDEFGGFKEIWNVTNPASPVALTDFQMQVKVGSP